MSISPFQKFLDLVSFDQNLNTLEHEFVALQNKATTLNHDINLLTQELEQYKHTRDRYKREVDGKELEMKDLQSKQEMLEKKLNTISHHKEYQSIVHEIDNLKKKQYEFENDLLNAWNEYENAMKAYDAKKKDIEFRVEQLISERQDLGQALSSAQEKIDQAYAQREAKVAAVPEQWLDKYALMRKTVVNPVVPVINDSCSACFYPLIRQDLIGLQKRQLLQCKSCFRFLYLKEAHEKSDT